MTRDESLVVIKDLMAAKSKEELQQKMGDSMARLDATFFGVLNDVVHGLRAQGKTDAARHLSSIGDSLARLRFLI